MLFNSFDFSFSEVKFIFDDLSFRTGRRIGKVLLAFTSKRNEKVIGKNSGKYFSGKIKWEPA